MNIEQRIADLTTSTKRHPRIWIPKPGDYIVGTITEFGFNTVEDCTYLAFMGQGKDSCDFRQ